MSDAETEIARETREFFENHDSPERDVKYRMYGFVPTQLSGIQKGIQFGHAVVEFLNEYGQRAEGFEIDEVEQWREHDKTFVILDGGTFPNMELLKHELYYGEMKFPYVSFFQEPDMNDAITGIAFLVPSTIYDWDYTGMASIPPTEWEWLKSFKLA